MYKKLIATLAVALLSFTLVGILSGCDRNSSGASSDILDIQASKQTSEQVEITNYSVIFKQNADEWNALSAEKREELVKAGYDQAMTKIEENETTNYNILGKASPVEDAEGNTGGSPLVFILDHEKSVLVVYEATSEPGAPPTLAELPIG
jgi:hypothetical protein